MGQGRGLPELTLTLEENNRLTEWTRRRKRAQALALRAGIELACAQGEHNGNIAWCLRVTAQTANGGGDSLTCDWTDCWMRLVLGGDATSAMRKSNKSSP